MANSRKVDKRMSNCYCYTCKRNFKLLGVMRHRAMHRDKEQDCTIRYPTGLIVAYAFNKAEDNNRKLAEKMNDAIARKLRG